MTVFFQKELEIFFGQTDTNMHGRTDITESSNIYLDNTYLLGLELERSLLFTASGTLSGGGGRERSFSLVASYCCCLSDSQNACWRLVLWAALKPCQERDRDIPPESSEFPPPDGAACGGLDNLSFTACFKKFIKFRKYIQKNF